MNYLNFSSIGDIIGKPVQNSLGQEYGKVSDIILSSTHHRAIAIVIEKGGFLGMGADHFILPWQKIRVNPNTRHVMVEADRKTIEDAPLIDISGLKHADPDSLSLMFNYYGVEDFSQETAMESEPYAQNYRAGEDTGERLPTNEGSHQITKHYPGPRESHTKQEANYDKIKGIGNADKK